MLYCIRAEFKDNKFQDFKVPASDLINARIFAEEKLASSSEKNEFDWRGQVVFVNQGYGVRV